MVIYSNDSEQTLVPGQALTLTRVSDCGLCYSGNNVCKCSNCPNKDTTISAPSVTIKGLGTFVAAFSGNISNDIANLPVELSITVNDTNIPTSKMISTPAAANVFNNVSAVTGFKGSTCCLGVDIAIVNTGTNDVTVAPHASLTVWRG